MAPIKFMQPSANAEEFRQQMLVLAFTILVLLISTFAFCVTTFVRETPLSKFLNNREKKRAKLLDKIELSHDTRLFRFELPRNHVLGLPCGQHIKLFCPNPSTSLEWNGKPDTETEAEIERKYTPTSSDRDLEHFDLVVKVYRPSLPRFPNGGKASQYLDSLKIGGEIEFSGPWGTITYAGNGMFHKSRKPLEQCTHVAMIAGGTGITPMLQVLEEILLEVDGTTKVSLLFANQTEEDILLRSRLDELARANPSRFKVHYTVDRVTTTAAATSPQWQGSVGFVTKQMMEDHLPKFGPDTIALVCGPPVMVKMLKENLQALDCAAERILEF